MAVRTAGGVIIPELGPLRRELRAVSKTAPKALQRTNKRVSEMLLPKVRSRYAARYRAGRTQQRGIRAFGTQRAAGLRIGGARYPYLPGQEWGSKRYPQFPPPTDRGYFLWHTVEEQREEILEQYADVLHDELGSIYDGRVVR